MGIVILTNRVAVPQIINSVIPENIAGKTLAILGLDRRSAASVMGKEILLHGYYRPPTIPQAGTSDRGQVSDEGVVSQLAK